MKVWLDVDCLDAMHELEESIRASTSVVLCTLRESNSHSSNPHRCAPPMRGSED